MSDAGSGEKTEEPTPERLRKLREDGNVPKSQDVNSGVTFLVAFGVLAASFGWISHALIDFTKQAIDLGTRHQDANYVMIYRILMSSLWNMTLACLPVLLAAVVIGVGMNIAQTGFIFTLKPITPSFEKLNPVNGLKGLFNGKKVVELVKTIIKFVAVTWLSYIALKSALRDVALIIRSDLVSATKIVGSIIWDFCIKIGGAFLVIAGFDAFYQYKKFIKENMMSKYDIKQEFKQMEGDPQHKYERKKMHQEILNDSGVGSVKNSDVVIRNPDHIAVAIKYDKEGSGAPKIMAKGTRLWAEKILEEARLHNIPIVRNVPLAQALNKLDIGEEIPEDLYEAVAEILTFVYNLAQEQKKKGK
jgi:flagellar biosynthetic protein FlhB